MKQALDRESLLVRRAASKSFEHAVAFVVFCVVAQLNLAMLPCLSVFAATKNAIALLPLEQMAYAMSFRKGGTNPWSDEYLKMLSPGGRVFFLANSRQFKKALEELDKLPGRETGSRIYVRAFCQDGMGKHKLAVSLYEQAKGKMDLVFNPGAKFYFHEAAAQFESGDLEGCLQNLAVAGLKSEKSQKYQRQPRILRDTGQRRRLAVFEKSGQYQSALDGYLKLFPSAVSKSLTMKPLTRGELEAVSADLRRVGRQPMPVSASKEQQCRYFLETGAAFLKLGELETARKRFEQAILIEPQIRNRIPTETMRIEANTQLGDCRAQAKRELAKIYFAQRKFDKCCGQIRSMFLVDPMSDFRYWLCSISMCDVPELVRQVDVDLHAVSVEHLLDERLLDAYGPSRIEYRGADVFDNDVLLKKARLQIERGEFSQSFDTLNAFVETNERLCTSVAFADAPERTACFLQDGDYRARLLRLGAGYAAGRIEKPPAFDSGLPLFKHADWDSVEDNLLGLRRKKNTKGDRSLSKPDFLARWHFASAVRAMYLGRFKDGAAGFHLAGANAAPGKDFQVYSRALEKYCSSKAK